jgi:hypothetical protein
VAKEASRPLTQGPSKLQGWRQGLGFRVLRFLEKTLLPLAHVPSWITNASDFSKSPNWLV